MIRRLVDTQPVRLLEAAVAVAAQLVVAAVAAGLIAEDAAVETITAIEGALVVLVGALEKLRGLVAPRETARQLLDHPPADPDSVDEELRGWLRVEA